MLPLLYFDLVTSPDLPVKLLQKSVSRLQSVLTTRMTWRIVGMLECLYAHMQMPMPKDAIFTIPRLNRAEWDAMALHYELEVFPLYIVACSHTLISRNVVKIRQFLILVLATRLRHLGCILELVLCLHFCCFVRLTPP